MLDRLLRSYANQPTLKIGGIFQFGLYHAVISAPIVEHFTFSCVLTLPVINKIGHGNIRVVSEVNDLGLMSATLGDWLFRFDLLRLLSFFLPLLVELLLGQRFHH